MAGTVMQGRAIIGRLADAWRALGSDRRVAALTSLGLFVTMLLPWYSKTDTVVVRNAAHATEQSLSAFQAFSFVEAAVLLVSAGVLALLFARAEEREFHLPGGDGTIVMVAGAWAAILIFYRLLDKPGLQGNEKVTSAVGVQWGIFIALLVALGLSYVGKRIRAVEHEEPPLMRSGEDRPPGAEPRRPRQTAADPDFYEDRGSRRARAEGEQPTDATRPVPARRPSDQLPAMGGEETEPTPQRRARPRFPPAPSSGSGQMSFEDTPPGEE
jgi:MFS family permease